MLQDTKNMTEGSPWRLITAFALPVFLSQLFLQLYNTADSLIVGKFLGTEALAAVSSSGTLIFMMVSFFTGTAAGAGVIIARYFGAGDGDRVSRAIHTNIALGICCGLLLTVAGVFLTPTLLRLMKTDPEVLPDAIIYFRYYFFGALAVVMYSICNGIMNALGDSRRPLYYLIISSVINIVLDILFIGGFGWKVWSAAFATTLSQAFSALLCMRHLCRKSATYRVMFRKIRFHGDMLREIIRYGLPSGIQNSVIAVANVVVQTNINVFGKFATAAYGTHAKIQGFAFLPITSFTMALTTFTGQNLGAGQYERARRGSRFGILSAMLLAELIGVVIFICAPFFVGLFSDDPQVIDYGVKQARTESLFYCLLAFSHAVAAVCRGAGKAFVPMAVMFAIWCVVRIVFITVTMTLYNKIDFVYLAYPVTWIISSVIYLFYYRYSDWIHGFDRRKIKQ